MTAIVASLLPAAEASAEETAELAKKMRAARHRADALTALNRGRGLQWAADITGLPLRFVARIAAQYGIREDDPEPEFIGVPSAWELNVLQLGRLPRLPASSLDFYDSEVAA